MSDVVIVGGGAAGLATAIFAAERLGPGRVLVLDGAARLGAKILVAGGGRCNVTHHAVAPEDFNGPRPVVRNVLAAFDVRATVAWFGTLGVELKREDSGKLFPVTDRARTVLDALVGRARALGVAMRCGARVDAVEADGAGGFRVAAGGATVRAARVVLATGGRSLPRSGSDGGGYALAERLGHAVAPPFPALVPLVLRGDFFHAGLKGVSHPATLTVRAGGRAADRRSGSLLWTHFGVSGPVVLDASRHWVAARHADPAAELRLAVLPDTAFGDVDAWLEASFKERPRATVGRVLGARLTERLAAALADLVGLGATRAGEVARPARRVLAHTLTDLPLPVIGPRGWDAAEVTAGGVPLAEVDYRTMESRRTPGLHLVGEILDCDGRIGGFNFQWAWSTGHVAGRGLARTLGA